VRIDSGDLAAHAREVRGIFDAAGLRDIQIIGSGGLDEYDLAEFTAAKLPFDSYGVGTQMGISGDAPSLDMAYKLVEVDGRPVLKLSHGKASMPGRKQVFRYRDARLTKDVIALADEVAEGGEALLQPVMVDGKIQGAYPQLGEIRERLRAEFALLDDNIKAVRAPAAYPVEISPGLARLREETIRRTRASESIA
jgi:nicotinate phosphoribosyltransferase